jgi:hypothetical protein
MNCEGIQREQSRPLLEDTDIVNSLQEPRKRLKSVSQDNKSAYQGSNQGQS